VSAPFVTKLRTGGAPIALAEPGKGTITIRVQASDLWETVRVTVASGTSIADVQRRVVEALYPDDEQLADFVLKFRGWELLDLNASLSSAGVMDGSILLLAHRRRRPVR
jgi:hypothetical protein